MDLRWRPLRESAPASRHATPPAVSATAKCRFHSEPAQIFQPVPRPRFGTRLTCVSKSRRFVRFSLRSSALCSSSSIFKFGFKFGLLCRQFVELRPVNCIEFRNVVAQLGLATQAIAGRAQVPRSNSGLVQNVPASLRGSFDRAFNGRQFAFFSLKITNQLLFPGKLLLQTFFADKRIAIIEAWTFNKRAARHKAVRENAVCLAAARQLSE